MAGRSRRKDPAAVALGRKGGKKGGPARAAKLTPQERSESARRAVQARWNKTKQEQQHSVIEQPKATPITASDTSDRAVLALLKRLQASNNKKEIRNLSEQLEKLIFHKQYRRT